MPCDTIQMNRIEITKLDSDLVRAVLKSGELEAAGYRQNVPSATWVSVYDTDGTRYDLDWKNGTISSRASAENIARFRNTLMKSYSRQALHVAAKRNGWKVRQINQNQYEVQ
jgi:hypothetical protein